MNITKIKKKIITFFGTASLLFIGYVVSRVLMYILGYGVFGEQEVYIAASSFSVMVITIYAFNKIRSKVQVTKSFSIVSFSDHIKYDKYDDDFAYICINDYAPTYKIVEQQNVLNLNINTEDYLNDIPYHIQSINDHGDILEEYFPAPNELLSKIVKFIDANRSKKAILIHCGLGLSRSTAIAKYVNQRFSLVSAEVFDKLQPSNGKHINNNIYTTLMTIKGLKEY